MRLYINHIQYSSMLSLTWSPFLATDLGAWIFPVYKKFKGKFSANCIYASLHSGCLRIVFPKWFFQEPEKIIFTGGQVWIIKSRFLGSQPISSSLLIDKKAVIADLIPKADEIHCVSAITFNKLSERHGFVIWLSFSTLA